LGDTGSLKCPGDYLLLLTWAGAAAIGIAPIIGIIGAASIFSVV